MQLSSKVICIAAAITMTVSGINGYASADDQASNLINKVIKSYGEEKLYALKTLKLEDKYVKFSAEQSHSAEEVDKNDYTSSIFIDFETNRKSLRWILGNRESFSIQHQVFDGTMGYSIDHSGQSLTENESLTFASVDRRISYHWDTVIAKLLLENQSSATHKGNIIHKGKPHEVISFEAAGYPEFTLMINSDSYLITQMERPDWVPGQTFTYHYSDHLQKDGISYANSSYMTRGGKPNEYISERKIEANSTNDALFLLPSNFGDAPASLNFSEMMVKKLSNNLYQTGQNWGFSLFYDAGDYYIGVGGYDRLTARLAALHKFTGNTKPLKYQIVTHHHLDHLGGMREAADLGAVFITVAQNVEPIRAAAQQMIPDDRFLIVDGNSEFENGAIKIADFPNGHSTHNLIPYFTDAKTVFSADLFFSRQVKGAPDGYQDLVHFKDFLKANDFDVDWFAAAHSGRLLTAADLDKSIANINEETFCPNDWDICEGYH